VCFSTVREREVKIVGNFQWTIILSSQCTLLSLHPSLARCTPFSMQISSTCMTAHLILSSCTLMECSIFDNSIQFTQQSRFLNVKGCFSYWTPSLWVHTKIIFSQPKVLLNEGRFIHRKAYILLLTYFYIFQPRFRDTIASAHSISGPTFNQFFVGLMHRYVVSNELQIFWSTSSVRCLLNLLNVSKLLDCSLRAQMACLKNYDREVRHLDLQCIN